MIKLQVKNMVCPRCIMAIENELEILRINPLEVRLGEVLLEQDLTPNQKEDFRIRIEKLGFELLDDNHSAIIHQMKSLIIRNTQNPDGESILVSDIIKKNMSQDYYTLSKLFSTTTGMTLEQFAIIQKIEKVKEWLIYDELNLKEIAYSLGYSSTAHLSSQFKKITGFTPSAFKISGKSERKMVHEL